MEAPRIPKLFGIKTKKPSQFYYQPRYYNERKEKMKKRYARIEKELALEEKAKKDSSKEFRATLKDNWNESRSKAVHKFNTRIILYALILLGLAYYILR